MSMSLGKTNHSINGSNSFIDAPNCGSNHSTTSSVHDEYNDESIEYKPGKLSTVANATMSPSSSLTTITTPAQLSPTSKARLNSSILSELHFRKDSFNKTMGGLSIPNHGLSTAFHGYHTHGGVINNTNSSQYNNNNNSNNSNNHSNNSNVNTHHSNNNSYVNTKSSPFLLPAQLYKSLFANAVLQTPDKMCSHPFPRNLLFSYSEKSPNSSDFETDDKGSLVDEVSFTFTYSYQW